MQLYSYNMRTLKQKKKKVTHYKHIYIIINSKKSLLNLISINKIESTKKLNKRTRLLLVL